MSMVRRAAIALGFVSVLTLLASPALSEPFAEPGDLRLRHDLRLLSDHGYLPMTLGAWPIAWPDVDRALTRVDATDADNLPVAVHAAKRRLRRRLNEESRHGFSGLETTMSAGRPVAVRGFTHRVRDNAEFQGDFSYLGSRWALNVTATSVVDPDDGDSFRPDGTYGALLLGGLSLSAGYVDRWWGPGWEGSLILSNNARPIPAVELTRISSEGFSNPWLAWFGSWNIHAFIGQFTDDRVVNNAKLIGARLDWRPVDFLEIGVSRVVQWGGDDRPQSFESFIDVVAGRDNTPADQQPVDTDPGNQIGGIDIRLSSPWRQLPLALYGEVIGDDEAGGLPSKPIAMAGLEWWGTRGVSGSWRVFLEGALTTRSILESDAEPNGFYNHFIYQTGYRFKDRVLGYPTDNDSRALTLGLLWAKDLDTTWRVRMRQLELNVDNTGANHSITPTGADRTGAFLGRTRATRWGELDWLLGAERVTDRGTGADAVWEGQAYFSIRYGL